MRIIQQENKYQLELSESEWGKIGEKNQWIKTAQLANDEYVNEAQVSFYINSRTPNEQNISIADAKTFVKYSIQIEARSWGIKGMTIAIRSIEPVTAVVEDYVKDVEQNKDVNINIDALQLKTESARGGVISTGAIDLWLNPDFSVDYNKSSITVYEL